MGKLYQSIRGKTVDMEKLTLMHETEPAVGNVRVNARGDELGSGGKVVRTREQVLQDYYSNNPKALKEEVKPSRKK
jgi:hypothetical protein